MTTAAETVPPVDPRAVVAPTLSRRPAGGARKGGPNTVYRTRHAWWAPYFFILPFLLIFLTFVIYPLIQSLYLSTQITAGPNRARFIGADNFRLLAGDDLFWKALKNTAFFALGSLLTQMPCALALALFLNQKKLRGRTFFRLVFFSPYLMGLIFVGLLVNVVLAENTGLANNLLNGATTFLPSVHFPDWFFPSAHWLHFRLKPWPLGFPWLKEHTRPALVLTALWVYTGFNMLYFLAALQNVSTELLEAAQVDGANAWHRFWHITLPSIRPVASYIALLSLLGSFQLFELPYILFASTGNQNGPDDQGVTIVMYLYQQAFERGNLGRACAMGWILCILLMLFAIGYRIITRSEEK